MNRYSNIRRRLLLLLFISAHSLLTTACTWVEVEPQGVKVQAITAGTAPPNHCRHMGEVEVSVLNKVWFYQRDKQKIARELEKLARNEAGHMDANIIQAITQPNEGRQRFATYRCP